MPHTVGDIKIFFISDLHDAWGVSRPTLQSYFREGKIRGRKLGTRWTTTEDCLREFFNSKVQAKKGRGNQTEDDSIESDDPKEHEDSEVGQYIVAGLPYCDRCHEQWGRCKHTQGLKR